jgi:hypothetical protein
MRTVLFLFLFSIFVGSAPDQSKFPGFTERVVRFIKLRLAESSGRKYVRSKLGAIGTYQITWICLKDYNKRQDTRYRLYQMYEEELAAYIAHDCIEVAERYFWHLRNDPIFYPCVYSSYNIGKDGTLRTWRGKTAYRINLKYIKSIISKDKMDRFLDNYIWIYSETKSIKWFVTKEDFWNELFRLRNVNKRS